MKMNYRIIILLQCTLLLAASPVVIASSCMSKAALEAIALEGLQPVFSIREARLNKVSLSGRDAGLCIATDARPTVSIAENGTLFSKMWLDMALPEGVNARFLADLTFDKRVWRLKQSQSTNSTVSLDDVDADWQHAARLSHNDSLLFIPGQYYRLLRNIKKNQMITAGDVARVKLIEAGQNVTAKYHSGSIKLEAKARALAAGDLNDTIAVLLSNQNEPVNAIIQNRMEVYVQQ